MDKILDQNQLRSFAGAQDDRFVLFGFLNVYKPEGITSHDVVAKLRRVTKIKQIGHTGTLDPFASGVLPVCIGKATRLIEFLNDDKEYIATVQFGANTDTYDREGEITARFDKKVTRGEVEAALCGFTGEIAQMPPIYSAIKFNGKKLYDYAREGKNVEIKPRNVKIYKIELLDFDENNQTAKILVNCSKGTYIRSIAFDLGVKLNCGGYLANLVRTKAGMFCVENSVKLEDLSSCEIVGQNLINPQDVIDLPKIEIDDFEHKKVIQGQVLKNKSASGNGFVILIYNNKIDAAAIVDGDKIKVKKVFL